MTRNLRAVLWLILALGALPCLAENLYPVDDSGMFADFGPFKASLMRAVKDRKASYVRSIVVPDTIFGYGQTTDGITAFSRLGLEDPSNPWWTIMDRILSMGGAWESRTQTMWFPYLCVSFPYARYGAKPYDSAPYVVVTGKNVNLRAGPDTDSRVLRQLSYEIVRLIKPADYPAGRPLYHLIYEPGWVRVRLEDGLTGYISTRYLYSPLAERAGFMKVGGEWKLLYFVRGD
jgi:hypothetical protein